MKKTKPKLTKHQLLMQKREEARIVKNSMTRQQFIDKYGKRAWNKFAKWMIGQTCAVIGNEMYYYNCDIETFLLGLPVID